MAVDLEQDTVQVLGLNRDLDGSVGEQPHDPRAGEHDVLRHHDAHGSPLSCCRTTAWRQCGTPPPTLAENAESPGDSQFRAVHNACSAGTCDDRRMTTSLLLVDDHEVFRRAARRMLEPAGFEVVGEATDGREALRLADALRPDVVLPEVQLPDLDGLEVAERIDAWHDGPDVVPSPAGNPPSTAAEWRARPRGGSSARRSCQVRPSLPCSVDAAVRRPIVLLVVVAGATLGLAPAADGGSPPGGWPLDLLVGGTFLAGGLVGHLRRPASWTGLLLAATGLAWFLGSLVW